MLRVHAKGKVYRRTRLPTILLTCGGDFSWAAVSSCVLTGDTLENMRVEVFGVPEVEAFYLFFVCSDADAIAGAVAVPC